MIVKSKRSLITFSLVVSALFIFFLPLGNKVSMPAVLKIVGTTQIYPTKPALLTSLAFESGNRVEPGQILAVLTSPDLEEEKQRVGREIQLLHARLARSQDHTEDHSLRLVLENELVGKQTEWEGLDVQIQRLTIKAPISGIVIDSDPALSPGMWLNPSSKFGSIKPANQANIIAYGNEDALMRVRKNAKGVFIPDNLQLPIIDVQLQPIAVVSAPVLHDEILADINGGPIPVSSNQDATLQKSVLKPHQSYFKMELQVTEPLTEMFSQQIIAGSVQLEAESKSIAARIGNRIASVLIREAGL